MLSFSVASRAQTYSRGKAVLHGLAFAALMVSSQAWAKGAGQYKMVGITPANGKYEGVTTITSAGPNLWKIKQMVGIETIEGFGVGDENLMAVHFSNGNKTGVVLYIARQDGGYAGRWAYDGDAKTGTEMLNP